MKQLTIRCPDDVAASAAERARMRGESVNDYVLALVREDLAYPTIDQWVDEVESTPGVNWDGSAADLVRADREER